MPYITWNMTQHDHVITGHSRILADTLHADFRIKSKCGATNFCNRDKNKSHSLDIFGDWGESSASSELGSES